MKYLLIAMLCFGGANDGLKGKQVSIGPMNYLFSYPAVWFSPEDTSVTSIQGMSEKPPDPRYKIWIEPRDPEINIVSKSSLKASFMRLGHGKALYENATKESSGKSYQSLPRDFLIKKHPVFIYKEGKKAWVGIILKLNTEGKEMLFKWRQLK